ncbi:hypothetical protein [Parasphingorhabdus flavimaris]|uniref:hypothetical protein n=1 Tax=Parasphingorhabdus flavimaris TaxID=266812 RepID=UPI0030026C12
MKTTLLKLSALGLATTALAPLPLLAKHHEAAETETMGTIDVAATQAALTAAQGRSDEDKTRDASRKPAEVLAFLGLEKGDVVLDLIASGG